MFQGGGPRSLLRPHSNAVHAVLIARKRPQMKVNNAAGSCISRNETERKPGAEILKTRETGLQKRVQNRRAEKMRAEKRNVAKRDDQEAEQRQRLAETEGWRKAKQKTSKTAGTKETEKTDRFHVAKAVMPLGTAGSNRRLSIELTFSSTKQRAAPVDGKSAACRHAIRVPVSPTCDLGACSGGGSGDLSIVRMSPGQIPAREARSDFLPPDGICPVRSSRV